MKIVYFWWLYIRDSLLNCFGIKTNKKINKEEYIIRNYWDYFNYLREKLESEAV